MVRGVLGAHIATTVVVVCVLVCMRGGRAFAACCARSCSRNNHRTLAFAQPRSSRSPPGISYTQRINCQPQGRLLRSSVPPGSQRRRPTHGKFFMSTSSSATACPVKRHRNTFLLPLQQQQQPQRRPQQGGASHSATPTHSQGGGGDGSALDGSRKSGEDHAAAADAAAAAAAAAAAPLAQAAGDSDEAPLALVILNAQGDGESESLLRHLWDRAALRVCADGGANRLHDSFGRGGDGAADNDRSAERARFVPDIIVGDLDSLRPEVARFYEGLGSEIKLRDDQDHCDFEKCLVEVERRLSPSSSPPPSTSSTTPAPDDDGADDAGKKSAVEEDQQQEEEAGGGGHGRRSPPPCAATVVGLGAFGGRFDHEMQAVSLLHAYTPRFRRLVLMGAGNVAFLLEPGLRHSVEPDPRFEGPTVGLIPVGGPCRAVNTEGLRWNLQGRGLEFGVCVSSSNLVVGDVVRVETDAPLVWTAEFKAAAWVEAISSGRRD